MRCLLSQDMTRYISHHSICSTSIILVVETKFCALYFRYPGYFDMNPPYKQNKHYWHIIAARLAFVFVFQFSVYLITSFIAWAVPDVPKDLDLKVKRENHLAKVAFKKKNDDYPEKGEDFLNGSDML